MPVLSLVATVDPEAGQAVHATLSRQPDLLVGEEIDGRLPIALDVPEALGVDARFQELLTIPGLLHLELVWADLSDLHAPTAQVSP